MTCRDIQRHLISTRYVRSLVCPNYTPANWWECDLFELTEAGYFREYEIKMSRSDFAADARKERTKWTSINNSWVQMPVARKHDQLAKGDVRGPRQFWFVVPEHIRLLVLPDWAGLIVCTENKWGHIETIEDRAAPRLHTEKANPKIREHLLSTYYWRFYRNFLRSDQQEEPCYSI